jgi:2-polyprenyl-3-methyl-5-hydroxy-6-metoxy-1,4-benzoquinol methylase
MRGGFISLEKTTLFSDSCRDKKINVYQDTASGIIYLDPLFSGLEPTHYLNKQISSPPYPRNDVEWEDARRRAGYLAPYIAGKRWCDFGCGTGYQLRTSAPLASAHLGLEVNQENLAALVSDSFHVSDNIDTIAHFKPQVVSLFHVFEHLADPVSVLKSLLHAADQDAVLLIEVPHAHDFLLHNNASFKAFTLWSEHLVLHTTASLTFIVEDAGWHIKELIGVQRYPVWNHLHWLIQGTPSGVKSTLADQAAQALASAYEHYLVSRGVTDTLVLVAAKTDVTRS